MIKLNIIYKLSFHNNNCEQISECHCVEIKKNNKHKVFIRFGFLMINSTGNTILNIF